MDEQEKLRYIKFEIAYSYCYEKIMSKYWGRLDKLASFLLLFAGMSVVASLFNGLVLGSSIALITSLQLIYSPGQKSQAAKECYREYYRLLNDGGEYTANELRNKLDALTKADTDEIGILSHAARLSALSLLGWAPINTNQVERKLNWLEACAAHFAGEYPEYPFPK